MIMDLVKIHHNPPRIDVDSEVKEELIIKVGNTNAVAAVFKQGHIIEKMRFDYIPSWQEELAEKLSKRNITAVLIGSVNSKAEALLRTCLSHIPADKIHDAKKANLALSIVDEQAHPSPEWGADILANAFAARKLYQNQNVIVTDIGTAVTDTYISADGRLLDVFISPGFVSSVKGIMMGTEAGLPQGLPPIQFDRPGENLRGDPFGCVYNGIYWRFIGGCKAVYELAKNRFFPGQKVTILATGGVTSEKNDMSGYKAVNQGFSEKLRKDLSENMPDIQFNADLTLIGFYEILQLLQSEITSPDKSR